MREIRAPFRAASSRSQFLFMRERLRLGDGKERWGRPASERVTRVIRGLGLPESMGIGGMVRASARLDPERQGRRAQEWRDRGCGDRAGDGGAGRRPGPRCPSARWLAIRPGQAGFNLTSRFDHPVSPGQMLTARAIAGAMSQYSALGPRAGNRCACQLEPGTASCARMPTGGRLWLCAEGSGLRESLLVRTGTGKGGARPSDGKHNGVGHYHPTSPFGSLQATRPVVIGYGCGRRITRGPPCLEVSDRPRSHGSVKATLALKANHPSYQRMRLDSDATGESLSPTPAGQSAYGQPKRTGHAAGNHGFTVCVSRHVSGCPAAGGCPKPPLARLRAPMALPPASGRLRFGELASPTEEEPPAAKDDSGGGLGVGRWGHSSSRTSSAGGRAHKPHAMMSMP
jgi:hypothetical protein